MSTCTKSTFENCGVTIPLFLGKSKFVLMYGGHVFPCQSYVGSTTVLHNTLHHYLKDTDNHCKQKFFHSSRPPLSHKLKTACNDAYKGKSGYLIGIMRASTELLDQYQCFPQYTRNRVPTLFAFLKVYILHNNYYSKAIYSSPFSIPTARFLCISVVNH